MVFFDVTVHNPSAESVRVSVLYSWQNVLGITGTACAAMYRHHAFRCDHSKKGYARPFSRQKLKGLKFGIDKDFSPGDPRRRGIGEVLIATEPTARQSVSTCRSWDERRSKPDFWDDFVETGSLDLSGRSRRQGKSGAVCVQETLPPETEAHMPFCLCWYMPHYVIEKNAWRKFLTGRHDGKDHGVYAANFFGDAEELAVYATEERERLREASGELSRLLKDPEVSNLPPWLVDVMLKRGRLHAGQLRAHKKGRLLHDRGRGLEVHALETPPHTSHTRRGFSAPSLAPLTSGFVPTPTHRPSFLIWTGRSWSLSGTLPRTERSLTGMGGQRSPSAMPIRPYSKPIPWINDGQSDWCDLNASLILQLGKLYKTTGDTSLLEESWPALMEMSDYLESLVKDHIPEACSTYDVFVYKPCFLYAATLYVATQEMLASLAERIPDHVDADAPLRAALFRDRASQARETLNRKLWNADRGFYRVCESRDTIFQGGLAGDWVARYSGLPPVVPPDRARSHARWQDRVLVRTAMKKGSLASGSFVGRPLPWNEATPEGRQVPLNVFGRYKLDVNYIYQVVSHQAFEAIYLGLVCEGLACLEMIYEKVYEEGYPWDMSLFGLPGFVYMTHPVMWALPNALTGAALDLPARTLYLSPRFLPGRESLRVPVFFPRFWLAVHCDKKTGQGSVRVLKRLEAADPSGGIPEDPQVPVLDRLILNRGEASEREVPMEEFRILEGSTFFYCLEEKK